MAGIERVHIDSNWSDTEPRVIWAREREQTANNLYREIFTGLGMELADGEEEIVCSKDELAGRYDWQEGIDCILRFTDGTKATMQEKFLSYHKSTITITENQKSKRGAFYTCTAQYYFVGYSRAPGVTDFQDWILVDLPRLHMLSKQNKIKWRFRPNKQPGYIGITFRYVFFDEVPESCVIDRMNNVEQQPQLFNNLEPASPDSDYWDFVMSDGGN